MKLLLDIGAAAIEACACYYLYLWVNAPPWIALPISLIMFIGALGSNVSVSSKNS